MTPIMLDEAAVLHAADEMKPYALCAFHHLHRHPETAHHETETNRYLRRLLDEAGIAYHSPASNITIAVVDSGLPGPTVGLRCDTDALPIAECTRLPYASENPGVMHACGHDAHAVLGLCAARLLAARPGQWRGRVKVIFQPAEEGEMGADEVIATGLVQDVDVFFAVHVWSPYDTGTLHVAPVTVSAAVNMFTVYVTGRGGHGATPERCNDALLAGAQMVTALQAATRRVSPMEAAVMTVGSFHAGSVGNIIAGEAVIKGTIRSLNEPVRAELERALAQIAAHCAEMNNCTARVENRRLSDVVHNDARAAEIAAACAARLVPPERLKGQSAAMLGDDFSAYGQIAPYCYAQLGIRNPEKDAVHAHHNGLFRVDEDVLPVGIAWMASFVAACGEKWPARAKG